MAFLRFLSHPAGLVLRYAVSLGLLFWIATRMDWAGFRTLGPLDWRLGFPALLLAGGAYMLQAWRWQGLLAALQFTLPGGRVHGVFWIGQFYNSFLPGGVAGDLYRFAWLRRREPGRSADIAANLLIDRLLGLAALFALAVLALAAQLGFADGGGGLRQLFWLSLLALLALLVLGWIATQTRWLEPLTRRLLGAARAESLHQAATALGRHRAALAWASLLSVLVWAADFVSLWLLARSLGLPADPLAMSVAAAAAYVAAALPVSIGGHGVREGALVAMLGLLAVGRDQPDVVSAFVLAFWAFTVGWSLLGGLIYLLSLALGWPLPREDTRLLSR